MKLAISLLLLLSLASPAIAQSTPAERWSFMGHTFGESEKEASKVKPKNFRFLACHNAAGRKLGLRVCSSVHTVDEGDQILLLDFVDDRLARISYLFPRAQYLEMSKGLKDKFGDPTLTKSGEWKNAMGASLTNEIAEWKSENAEATSFERSHQVDQSAIVIEEKSLSAEYDKRMPKTTPDI